MLWRKTFEGRHVTPEIFHGTETDGCEKVVDVLVEKLFEFMLFETCGRWCKAKVQTGFPGCDVVGPKD